MRQRTWVLVLAAFAIMDSRLGAAEADLSFKPAGEGWFAFDTGAFKGKLQADGKSQGIPTFIDGSTNTELAYGGTNPGILSFYRVFSAGKRWGDPQKGDTMRQWTQVCKVLPGGSVEVFWPAADDHPVEVRATFTWVDPGTIEVVTTATPRIDMPKFEIFISSYFNNDFQNYVYVAPPRHAGGKARFLCPTHSELIDGTYTAFPRDLPSAQMIYDGRWEQGHSPVQWSITQLLAAPVCLMRDAKKDITFVKMSRPQDCFAIEMPYFKSPPDGIAGHRSLYMSLFGGDLRAGQSAKTCVRLVVGRGLSNEKVLGLYEAFIKGAKE